ncbi:hypothetical protein C8R47DRAFT_1135380 [Mycena vitilis]|nr:hypothetical protein C8R47DRAFT_1135380 [Mycena vitilis]
MRKPSARPQRKYTNKKKLTVADINVPHVIVGRPPSASILASACTSPDVFATHVPQTPMTPRSSASGQWPASPPPLPLARSNATKGKMGASGAGAAPSAPSAALYAAYTTQRSPRRRVSTSSNASGWSYSSSSPGHSSSSSSSPGHSSPGSESGHSECSAGSVGSALRRKPIPVEMFLR